MDNKAKVEQDKHLEQVHQALKFVADKLNKQKIDWFLGASGALMVWGVKIVPHDLDIFTSAENIKKLSAEDLRINDIEVEIHELDFSPDALIKVPFEDTLVPVNSLETELKFYKEREGKEKITVLIEKRLRELAGFEEKQIESNRAENNG